MDNISSCKKISVNFDVLSNWEGSLLFPGGVALDRDFSEDMGFDNILAYSYKVSTMETLEKRKGNKGKSLISAWII